MIIGIKMKKMSLWHLFFGPTLCIYIEMILGPWLAKRTWVPFRRDGRYGWWPEPSTTSWYGKYQISLLFAGFQHHPNGGWPWDFFNSWELVSPPKSQSFSNLTTEVCNIFRRRETMWEILENGCCVLLRWLLGKKSFRHCVLDSWLSFSVKFCCSQNRVRWLSISQSRWLFWWIASGGEVIVGLITAVSFWPQPIVQILDLGYFWLKIIFWFSAPRRANMKTRGHRGALKFVEDKIFWHFTKVLL